LRRDERAEHCDGSSQWHDNGRIGAVVTDAKVTLVSEATQETQTAVTGPTGTYQFPLLKPGKYSVTVEKAGFRRIVDRSEVLLGQTTTINAKLEIGEATQTIESSERTIASNRRRQHCLER